MDVVRVVLISTYELGRQPFGLASPAAWLRADGHEVTLADLSRGPLPWPAVERAGLIAFFLPMHTATRLVLRVVDRVRAANPRARLCAYGLYAPLNEELLRRSGVSAVIGGEFEQPLVDLAAGAAERRAATGNGLPGTPAVPGSRPRRPAAAGRVRATAHRWLDAPRRDTPKPAAGCKHLCRHCPVVPVYGGLFRIVQRDVVLEDIRRQVAAGAEHITFGDPDFFNGPGHAIPIVEALHREWPRLSYDVTIKMEHLLRHRDLLPVLRRTGCLFVTSAVESFDDAVLERLAKGHTQSGFPRRRSR